MKSWITGSIAFVIAAVTALGFVFPQAVAAVCPRCFGFARIAPAIYVEGIMTPDARTNTVAIVDRARQRVRAFYGEELGQASVLVCATDACYRRLKGGGSRGMAIYDKALLLAPSGIDETIAAHELAHIELHVRIGTWRVFRRALPVWFDEGLAVVVSDDRRYLGAPGMTDVCRGVGDEALPSTLREWFREANHDDLYYKASCRANRWLAAKGGPAAVIRLAQRIASGEDFAEASR